MTPALIGIDPSDMLLGLLSEALPDASVGWDMPEGPGPKCMPTLSPGSSTTPVTQRMTLTLSCYAPQADGSCDWPEAARMFTKAVRAVLAGRKRHPLVDAALQAGPVRQHDARLDVDYAYGAVLLTVAAN
ncbi:hypothetical protein [Bifidobacterium aerophilum]|uniref:DUF3168 domain-containing protein n=1 Tax=Bifidobacterium aerophilum TaxID=1798155 RepID=A0A6N9Z999_9BIFI|nr:hypothetical protein [Bifidobacterium aerophilum]NEG90655.1 hypothetical protein [Bifidobacterium aerophilum]